MRQLIRIIFLIVVILLSTLLIFGSDIFFNQNYQVNWGNKKAITVPGWTIIVWFSLLLYSSFLFFREWYHGFKREILNAYAALVSLLFLIWSFIGFYILNKIENQIFSLKKALSNPDVSSTQIETGIFYPKLLCMLSMLWAFVMLCILAVKVYTAVNKKTNPMDLLLSEQD